MTTETDLVAALRTRADEAPSLDVDHLLGELALDRPAVRSTVGASHGRRWAIAGVAAGIVAAVAVPTALVAHDGGSRTVDPGGVVAPSASPTDAAASDSSAARASEAAAAASAAAAAASAASASAVTTNPYDPAAPVPLDASWVDTDGDQSVDVDPAAIVFSQDPIVAFYVRPHQQLSILPGGGSRKDSSDAPWEAAVQVYLAGSGFDPTTIGTPTTVTVDGVSRQFGTLPKLLDMPGPDRMPSLLWQVGDAWVVLQIDNPAVPTADQLATAAARLDVHHG